MPSSRESTMSLFLHGHVMVSPMAGWGKTGTSSVSHARRHRRLRKRSPASPGAPHGPIIGYVPISARVLPVLGQSPTIAPRRSIQYTYSAVVPMYRVTEPWTEPKHSCCTTRSVAGLHHTYSGLGPEASKPLKPGCE
jgi:hypothetical protein